MKRDQKTSRLVELGRASTRTQGPAIVGNPEQHGFYTLGLSNE